MLLRRRGKMHSGNLDIKRIFGGLVLLLIRLFHNMDDIAGISNNQPKEGGGGERKDIPHIDALKNGK